MEKVVYILRHGKAENAEEGDFERRLIPVGEGDVREIGGLLAGAGAALAERKKTLNPFRLHRELTREIAKLEQLRRRHEAKSKKEKIYA